jgi:hypothetical protein
MYVRVLRALASRWERSSGNDRDRPPATVWPSPNVVPDARPGNAPQARPSRRSEERRGSRSRTPEPGSSTRHTTSCTSRSTGARKVRDTSCEHTRQGPRATPGAERIKPNRRSARPGQRPEPSTDQQPSGDRRDYRRPATARAPQQTSDGLNPRSGDPRAPWSANTSTP